MVKTMNPKADYSLSRKSVFKLLAIAFVTLSLLTQAKHAFAQVFTGQVIEENSRVPVPNAVVELLDVAQERIRTISADEKGYYIIKAPEAEKYYIHVRRIGYVENTGGPFTIGSRDTLNIDFRILKETVIMDEITVAVEAHNKNVLEKRLDLVNFNSRKKSGFGQYFTRNEIKEKNLFRLSSLFRGLPGVKVNRDQVFNTRSKCLMKVLINGFEVIPKGGSSIDEFITPTQVIAVEIYSDLVAQPKQFGTLSECGLVLIWTR